MIQNYYEIPESLASEINDYEGWAKDFEAGKISGTEFRARRVPFGVYEQREDGTFMTRIRAAGGGITPLQLKKAAFLANAYGSGILHVTTRMELQVHYVILKNTPKVIRELLEVGLGTRGGGGNTVRNIMASWDAGIDPEEVFDVTPHAAALTSRLISEPDSWTLPRKFKISFSGSDKDTGLATVNDLGFIAKTEGGQRGFKVYAAGGMGHKPSVGLLLFDFVQEKEVYDIARAMKVFFDQNGNRKNKHLARLRHLRLKLGDENFKERFHEYHKQVIQEGHPPLELKELPGPSESVDLPSEASEEDVPFQVWKKRYVRSQKQEGYSHVLLPLILGDITWEKADKLADFLGPFGPGCLRFTCRQNMALRHIPDTHLGNIFNGLKRMDLLPAYPKIIAENSTCTGAATCRLGIGLSRGLSEEISRVLKNSGMDLDALSNIKINISGCPNSCGQNWIGDINFAGKVMRKGEHSYPAYNVILGAKIGNGKSRLARSLGIRGIAAKAVPAYTEKLLKHFLEHQKEHKDFYTYIENGGWEKAKSLLSETPEVPAFEENPDSYYDWSSREKFSTVGMGQGECSAGLFDLIEMDLKNSEEAARAFEQGNDGKDLYRQLLCSTRALLITKGIETKTPGEIFDLFQDHFVEKKLVDKKYRDLMSLGRLNIPAQSLDAGFRDMVSHFSTDIQKLYDSMDNSLRFPQERETEEKPKEEGAPETSVEKANRKEDFRGVPCPMNYVKTKLILETMNAGETIEVLLDDGEPIRNVPRSVDSDGFKILKQTQIGDHWSIVIRK